MDEAINVILSNGFSDTFGAFDVDVFKGEVSEKSGVRRCGSLKGNVVGRGDHILSGVVAANEIEDNIRMSD